MYYIHEQSKQNLTQAESWLNGERRSFVPEPFDAAYLVLLSHVSEGSSVALSQLILQ